MELAEHRRAGKRLDPFGLATLAERHDVVGGGVVGLHVAHLGSDAAYRHGACSAEIFLLKPVEVMSAAGAQAGSVNNTD